MSSLRRTIIAIAACSLVAVVAFVLNLALGREAIPLAQVAGALLPLQDSVDPGASAIVVNLRLPRALVAAAVGACLAVAGCLLQAVMQNPLAAPNIVGVTAGAGLGATLVLTSAASAALLAPAAFTGAMLAAIVVYALSYHPTHGTSPIRMVLAGVAVTAILTAVQTFVMLLHPERVQSVVMWMAGSLNFASNVDTGFAFLWTSEPPDLTVPRGVIPYAIVALPIAFILAKPLDVLALGEDRARSLGVRVEPLRFTALAVASLLAGAAVSVAGLVAFVGLIVPHACRFIVGPAHARLIPTAAVAGAALLLLADLAARTATEQPLPVGILTALLGGPYFLALLYTSRILR